MSYSRSASVAPQNSAAKVAFDGRRPPVSWSRCILDPFLPVYAMHFYMRLCDVAAQFLKLRADWLNRWHLVSIRGSLDLQKVLFIKGASYNKDES